MYILAELLEMRREKREENYTGRNQEAGNEKSRNTILRRQIYEEQNKMA
jgi:hypothetical protein